MRYILILIIVFLVSPAAATENVKVELYKNGSLVPLNSYQATYLYGNTIGLLSTCRHLEIVTGNTYTEENGSEALAKIKSGNHVEITFSKGSPRLPIAHGNEEIEVLHAGFDKNGFPSVVTVNKGKVQLYAKCSGSITIANFSCDKLLSELLSFEIDNERCKTYLKEIETSQY